MTDLFTVQTFARKTVSDPHVIEDADDVREFVLAGNATFTLVSLRTENRFTFKVKLADGEGAVSKFHLEGEAVFSPQ